AIGAKLGEANCIKALGDVHRDLSELPEARARYEEALPIYRAIGDKLGEANTLSAILRLEYEQTGNVSKAEDELRAVIQIRQKIGDLYGEAADCGNFAILLLKTGHKEPAKKYFRHTREIFAHIGVKAAVEMTDRYLAACEE
ncbi:MAG: tetratricopeptide repeat protein, partial [Anaerolineales bacterium]